MSASGRPVLALLLTLLAPGLAIADLTAKPDAYTEKDRYREKLEYNRKTLVDPYKAIGKKDPKWDAAAIKFLEMAARQFASVGTLRLYGAEGPKADELLESGKAAVKLGCDDPMVLYCYSAFLQDLGHTDEAKPVLEQAYKGLLVSKYPVERHYFAALRMRKTTESAPQRVAVNDEIEKLRPKVLATKFINSAHRRALAETLWEEFPARPPAKRLAFYEEMKKNNQADQWIVNLFGGQHFIKAAWDARGGGWANEVKEQGWLGFEENLSRARECLVAAWKLAPNLPEAPAEMITVTMGQGERRNETLRTWFDRAVEAQFDYTDAYNKLCYALLPRWHGTHEEILAVGIECYRTERYDTMVPYQLLRCLERIRDDRGGDMSLWDKPEMYQMLRDLMLKYAEQFKGKVDHSYHWYLSYAAALANRNGRHEDARKLLDELGDKVVEDRYGELRQLPKISVSESYLLTGPLARRFSEAIELQKQEKHEQVVEAIEKIIEELPKDDKGLLNAQFHLRLSQMALALAKGDWVDLSPWVDRVPWGAFGGEWSMPREGELMGVAEDQRGLMAMCQLVVPARYEFSAQCEVKAMEDGQKPSAGMLFNYGGRDVPYPGVWVFPTDKKLVTRSGEDEWHDVDCQNTFKLTLRVWDDRATVLLDDKEVARFRGVGRPNARRLGVGLTGMHNTPNGAVVFRELKVRKLKEEPDGK